MFTQISNNKEFLMKISSLINIKNIHIKLKNIIIDLIYEWK